MCQPKNQGGRRCAAHTRPAYQAAIARIDATPPGHLATQVDAMADIARHAATPAGAREVQQLRDDLHGRVDYATSGYLDSCLRIGAEMARTFDAVEAEIARQINEKRQGRYKVMERKSEWLRDAPGVEEPSVDSDG